MSNPSHWLEPIARSRQVAALREALRASGGSETNRSGRRVSVSGGKGSSSAILAGALAVTSKRPVLLVVAHLDEADDALDDLEAFAHAGHELTAERFGALEVLPGESSISLDLLAERLALVDKLGSGAIRGSLVVVAPIQAIMQAVPDAEAMAKLALTLAPGIEFPLEGLVDWLAQAGFERQDAIEQPGDFAVRGGLIDIYLPTADGPVRLDFFGDELDTIHRIDPDSMGSREKITEVRLVSPTPPDTDGPADAGPNDEQTQLAKLLPEQSVVVLNEIAELTEQARGYYERLTNLKGVFSPNTVMHHLTQHDHVQVQLYGGSGGLDGEETIQLPIGPLPVFDSDAQQAVVELGELAGDEESRVTVVCQKEAEATRLRELLQEHVPHTADRVSMDVGYLHRGFAWQIDDRQSKIENLYLLPHHEIFHRYETRRRIRKITADAAGTRASDAFLDLEPGDFVVHVDHGIAQYDGIIQLKRSGLVQDYLRLIFANDAALNVPVAQIDLIQKYIGGFEGRPPLSILGGKTWQHQKDKTAEAVKDLAKELLQVQAARVTQSGIRFPADTAWQKEFEAEFPYQETDDQLTAVSAIKRDMQGNLPMDRLVCGDVGFGKTEVAIRAAFKAVEYGKQVAVLVPTTVLAEQHTKVFQQRMAAYPFRIHTLSRFRTTKEAKLVLAELQSGMADIVIGTHRLLSQDVLFKDLGLVVIDEEQRFGVEHKNKLLSLRMTADVLTLSATPIPRTLHMSMVGLRDISSLTQAPVDRRAVVTEVIPYDNQRIKQAINREMARDGQCFFVHNRVNNIKAVAAEIQQLVPEARVIVGHGQMAPRKLEDVMLQFTRREADILVATTIIESGIDIPTANTMFINDSDRYGLAQLHQLRGRVGRHKHRAYCYMLLPPERTINEVATKRLRAIEGYAMLGAGFKIAMRDLEIRGAGNLLGKEQSGHIAAVGYEMYCLLLEQETKRLKNEKIIEPCRTHLEVPIHGGIPKRYVTSDKRRLDLYRRLSRANTLKQLDEVEQAMRDAYGDPPKSVQLLYDLTELRIAASTLGIDKIKLEKPDLIFKVRKVKPMLEVFGGAPGRISVIDDFTMYWRPPENYLAPPETLLAVLRKLLVRRVDASD